LSLLQVCGKIGEESTICPKLNSTIKKSHTLTNP